MIYALPLIAIAAWLSAAGMALWEEIKNAKEERE